MRINFDFQDLETFLTVVETLSFHQAGARLNLSQSAVTRRIQKLEDALGSELFERSTRAVKPTLAAKRLISRAEAILDGARETTLAMRDESMAFAHQRHAVITIAIIPTVMPALLPEAIRIFRAKGFDGRIRILDFAANEVAEAVAQGDADFGICSIGSLEQTIRFERLFEDRIVAAFREDRFQYGKGDIAWSALQNEPLIFPARGTGNRLLIDEAMARARTGANWTYEVNRSTSALDLARAGTGVALLPRSAVPSKDDRLLVVKDLHSPVVSRPVGLISRSGLAQSAGVSAMMQSVGEVVLRAHR